MQRKTPIVKSRRRFLQAAGASLTGAGALAVPFNTAWAADAKSLVVVIGSDVGSLDPDKYTNWNDYWAYGNMFEGLYRPNEKGDLAPGLAEWSEVTPDGLTYRFRLRAGAKFHNGDPVTSDDVIFSINRSRDPAIQNQRASLLDNIAEVVRTDDRQFTVRLKAIDAETIPKLSLYWQVKPKRYIETVGNADFAKKPVGTGPFEFAERTPAQFLKMRAFPGYWGTRSSVAEVTIKIAPEEQSRIAQVMAGEADVATPISPVLASRMGSMPALQVVRVPSFLNVIVYFNTLHPETTKPDVRRALCMAVDRDALLKTIMLGYAAPQELWCTSAQPACSLEGLKPYKYDPQQARDLLRKANFDFGKPLRFVGQAPGRVAASKETCEAITEYWKRIGVQVNLEILEFGAWNAIKQAKTKDPTVAMIYATGPDPSKDVAYKLLVNTQSNLATSWVWDKRHDEMLGRMNSISDTAQRNAYINKILRRLHEDAQYMPLWANDTLFVTRKSVKFDVPPYLSYTALEKVTKTA
jgi:peptide/nickel transport system substrate-binding protein